MVRSVKQKMYPFRDVLRALRENRKELPYAWKILNHGVCDVCSLSADGLHHRAAHGLHLCTRSLESLKLNTMAALDLSAIADLNRLRSLAPEELRYLGRLAYPMIRRRNEPGFLRCSWEETFDLIGSAIHDTAPHEMAFLATPHRLTNETYYTFQKLARVLGTNNIDLCARPSDDAAVYGLKSTLGFGAATCSLSDCVGTDLVVIFGSDLLGNQPLTTKYLRHAAKTGTRIVAVNAPRERAMASYSGRLAGNSGFRKVRLHEEYPLRPAGEIAFINGVLKTLIANDQVDHHFIENHTACFHQLCEALQAQSWQMLEQGSGVARMEMQEFAIRYGAARSTVFVYPGAIDEYGFAIEKIKAIINLSLARGMLGREKCGIIPIGVPSSIQAAYQCGAEPDKFPGGFFVNENSARRFSNLWRHPVPSNPGLAFPDMIDAAHTGQVRFMYCLGSDPLEIMSDTDHAARALSRLPVRVHQDIALNPSMLLDSQGLVLILPGQTRYEQRTGGTCTSSERQIYFTPEITGHQIGETLPEWEILGLIGRKAMPNGDKLFPLSGTQAIRNEMSRVMPIYQGIEKLTQEGDQLQWGGAQLYRDGFSMMPGNRALFTALEPPALH